MSESVKAKADEAQARGWLAEFYTPEGVDVWLTGYNRFLGWRRAADLIAEGEGDRVLALIAVLRDGAFA